MPPDEAPPDAPLDMPPDAPEDMPLLEWGDEPVAPMVVPDEWVLKPVAPAVDAPTSAA